jgi:hypothetical protein
VSDEAEDDAMKDDEALRESRALLDEGRIVSARSQLVEVHEPGPGGEEMDLMIEGLWGLDLELRRTVLQALYKELKTSRNLDRELLQKLVWIISRRLDDLQRYLDKLPTTRGARAPKSGAKRIGYPSEERSLRQALRDFEHRDLQDAHTQFGIVLNASKRRLEAIEQLIVYPAIHDLRTMVAQVPRSAERIHETTWQDSVEQLSHLDAEAGESLRDAFERIRTQGIDALREPGATLGRRRRRGIPSAGPRRKSRRVAKSKTAKRRSPAGRRRGGRRGGGAPPDNGGGRDDTPPVLVRRTPHMDLSESEPLQPGTRLTVGVYADKEAPRPGEESEDILVRVPEHLMKIAVRTELTVSPHFTIVGDTTKQLIIDRREDRTEMVVFTIRVRSREEMVTWAEEMRRDRSANLVHILPSVRHGSITAIFTYQDRPSGKARRLVEVDLDIGERNNEEDYEINSVPSSIVIESNAIAADLLVHIVADEINNGRQFRCRVSSPLIAEDEGFVPWNLPDVTRNIVVGHMEQFVRDDISPIARRGHLRGAGKQLFEASPGNFQELFWRLVDGKKRFKSIGVVSDEPFIPWELMVPWRRHNGKVKAWKLPLGVKYAVGRWTPKKRPAPPQSVPLNDSLIVAPKYRGNRRLPHSEAEADFVIERFFGTPVRPASVERLDATLSRKKV